MMANDFLYIWIFQSILILYFILSIIVCEYLSGWGCLGGTMSDRSETRILQTEMACIYAPHKSHIDNQNAWVSTNCHQPLATMHSELNHASACTTRSSSAPHLLLASIIYHLCMQKHTVGVSWPTVFHMMLLKSLLTSI
jgi:hypothetical protein